MNTIFSEIFVRLSLSLVALYLNRIRPFNRKIHQDEMWLYKNPRTASYVTTSSLWVCSLIVPVVVISCVSFMKRRRSDALQGILACSLACVLNALLTNIVKISVGRPRPDFFWRCYPDGIVSPDFKCTGDDDIIDEGRKSFPSGHSSWAFTGLGFLFFYIAGKLHTFSLQGKGQGWRLVVPLTPLVMALTIALSRTCDYHHHWQDVLCGSVLGLSCAYVCYRHYYPKLSSPLSDQPFADMTEKDFETVNGVKEV